ncbi:ATP-binding protein [Opitutus terrae]|uniref:ORC1/DEAH AAA+ ATPase domain-containing protein n=1 Tax=Opitutus terrae (strain DSM 11246 / JCM 15787 / PB90-1) TaxID=452637 RepID=B1ZUA9_OPITP|nr:ATP-binding protein [Opitutus terrae]ACB76671.1 hypothetical protein Oter_3394 [Opitutus terrae PB90-1]
MSNIQTAERTNGNLAVTVAGSTGAIVPTNKHLADRAIIRGDVNAAIERFAHYPDAVREGALWLRLFTQQKLNGEHALLWKLACALGLRDASGNNPSDQYWYQVVTGRYFKPGGDAKRLKVYIDAIRAHALRQERAGMIGFVETDNWTLFRDYVDSRRTFSSSCRVGAVEGLSGAQKTSCRKQYTALNNHRETVGFEAPARATRARVVQKLAELYQVAESKNVGGKEVEIERFLKSAVTIEVGEAKPRCIIIDNVQRLFRPNVQPDQQPVFNYLHELQDDIGFCLILMWVPSFTRVITSNDPYWAQWVGRIGGPDEILRLDQKLPRKDLLKFAREFRVVNDPEAYPLLKKWNATPWGCRVPVQKLEKARKLANAESSDEISVDHLRRVDSEPVIPPAGEEDEQ